MRLFPMSDLHLEHYALGVVQAMDIAEDDVLVLAGDIVNLALLDPANVTPLAVRHRAALAHFREAVADRFAIKIVVPGNHESYGGYIEDAVDGLVKAFPGAFVLENESVVICGVRFVGATLWSDFEGGDPASARACTTSMNDFRLINTRKRLVSKSSLPPAPLSADDLYERHVTSRDFIFQEVAASSEPCVVVTHHAPSMRSNGPRQRTMHGSMGRTLVGGFCSALDEQIVGQIMLTAWIHGHTHFAVDYTVGGTRIVSNPRGYFAIEKSAATFDPWRWFDPLEQSSGMRFAGLSPSSGEAGLQQRLRPRKPWKPREGMSGSGSRSAPPRAQ